VSVSRVEVKEPPKDHFVRVHPEFNEVFSVCADSEAKSYIPYLIAPGLVMAFRWLAHNHLILGKRN
jgi:hypothetical protein